MLSQEQKDELRKHILAKYNGAENDSAYQDMARNDESASKAEADSVSHVNLVANFGSALEGMARAERKRSGQTKAITKG